MSMASSQKLQKGSFCEFPHSSFCKDIMCSSGLDLKIRLSPESWVKFWELGDIGVWGEKAIFLADNLDKLD